nr:MAG TPA: Serine-rich adhesin for platelets Beta, Adhesion, Carbohydrate/Sugar Binding [Caudoviricetes sp.]DAK00533.1 MAG TPA: Serine-rich adhesin for platelets Beta, Adhesion, Carbohydrate/Sugar Binding [Caudoviricetes sp.]
MSIALGTGLTARRRTNGGGSNILTIIPATLPTGRKGTFYGTFVNASGGTGVPYSYAVIGALPPGLSQDANGSISGTPTVVGTFNFMLHAQDRAGNYGARAYTVEIMPVFISISPSALPTGILTTPYSVTISATGGNGGPFTFTVSAGALPDGLSFGGSTGVLSGTPTVARSFNFTIRAQDTDDNFSTRPYMVTIRDEAFTPALMFTAGEKGAWYDPSDISTLFQDNARNEPVTADGQRVAAMLDKSPNGNHLIVFNDNNRPIYRVGTGIPYLEVGSTHFMASTTGIAYDSSADNVYLGCMKETVTALAAMPILTMGATDQNHMKLITAGGTNLAETYFDGNELRYSKGTLGNSFRYMDSVISSFVVWTRPPNSMDIQVDGIAGVMQSNAGVDPVNVSGMKIGINTITFDGTGGGSGTTVKWFGGIVVLRTTTQDDRDSLRAYFSSSR